MSGYFLNASICVALFCLSGGTFEVLIDEVVMIGIGQPALLACPFSSTTRDFARATWAREVRLSHQTQRQILASVAQCQDTKIISCNISRINPEKYALGGTLTEGLMMMIQQVAQYDEGVYLCTAVLRSSVTERRIRLDIANGNPETFNVKCCNFDIPLNCTEVSNVTQTRLSIGDLRSSTSYRVCVQSQYVFGFGEDSESIEIATKHWFLVPREDVMQENIGDGSAEPNKNATENVNTNEQGNAPDGSDGSKKDDSSETPLLDTGKLDDRGESTDNS